MSKICLNLGETNNLVLNILLLYISRIIEFRETQCSLRRVDWRVTQYE